MPPFLALSWPARLYAVAINALGVATLVIGWVLQPVAPDHAATLTLVYLAVLTQLAALRPIPWKAGVQSVKDPMLIATALYSPGVAVGLIGYLATFDGRIPGRGIPWWTFFFNRAQYAIGHVIPSLVLARLIPGPALLPLRAIALIACALSLNYLITALAFSAANRSPFWTTLLDNIGLGALLPTVALNFAGAILVLLLNAPPKPVGYFVAPGLFGFVIAVRATIADGQRQTILKNQTLDLAAQALDARDRYTESHSIRVSELAGRLGEQLELSDRDVELIRTAGSLHDLGKIGVRDDILNKAGPLSEEEWEVMRRHPDIGADMIAQHSALAEVAPLVRHHHERWDGTGYPEGLSGDAIPFGARILSVADSFDTITGARLYRRSLMTPIEAVEDISRRAAHWYDPNIVDSLREIYGLKAMEVVNRPPVPRRISTLRVIRANPGFSNLMTAIGVSSLGDPLTQVATLVTIYAATQKAGFVALSFIAQALATVLMSTALGGVVDRLPRRGLVVVLELLRAGLLMGTPFVLGLCGWHRQSFSCSPGAPHWWLIIPILFCLAGIKAVVQPARQAAVPSLVPPSQVGKANAIVAATTMLAGAVGYAAAGGILFFLSKVGPGPLFMADAITFVAAAGIVLGIPTLGGGVAKTSLSGALVRSWAVAEARPHLVVGGLAALLLPISLPALLAMAYQMRGVTSGGALYAVLELVLTIGTLTGSVLVSRSNAIGTMRTVGGGLFVTGLFSVAIWIAVLLPFAPNAVLLLIALALFIASIGNPIYTVANQTAILEAADPSNRGSLMATRFGLVQTASIVGTGVGGFVTQIWGPEAAYGVLGVGLVLLAIYALATRQIPVRRLDEETYEDSRFGRAKT